MGINSLVAESWVLFQSGRKGGTANATSNIQKTLILCHISTQKHGECLHVTSKKKKEGNVITQVGSRLSYIKSHEVKLNTEKSWVVENISQQLLFVCGNRWDKTEWKCLHLSSLKWTSTRWKNIGRYSTNRQKSIISNTCNKQWSLSFGARPCGDKYTFTWKVLIASERQSGEV